MRPLYAGFARVDCTPPLGIAINGYFVPRIADGVLDPLEINCLALSCGKEKVVLLSMDNTGISNEVLADIFPAVCHATGLPREAVFIHSTHTHTGGALLADPDGPLEQQYKKMTCQKMAAAAKMALDDLKPARMGYGTGTAPNVAFVRRYRMKDGSIRTNPGVNNPDILEPIGKADDQVSILRFDQEGGSSLVLIHFANHPDTVGGCKLSADWPGFARRTVEQSLPGTKAIFFNGAQGEINHVNVHPKEGEMNGLSPDFDGVSRGYDYSRHIGRVVAGAVLQSYDTLCYTAVTPLSFAHRRISVPANVPTAQQLPLAKKYAALHQAGLDAQIPYTGMELTTAVAEALRMVRLADGPEFFEMSLSGIAIGPVALVGFPGEPFSGIGREIKAATGWAMVIPTCNTGGKEGYFPTQDAFAEGGYEARSSAYKAGVAELLVREASELLGNLQRLQSECSPGKE